MDQVKTRGKTGLLKEFDQFCAQTDVSLEGLKMTTFPLIKAGKSSTRDAMESSME